MFRFGLYDTNDMNYFLFTVCDLDSKSLSIDLYIAFYYWMLYSYIWKYCKLELIDRTGWYYYMEKCDKMKKLGQQFKQKQNIMKIREYTTEDLKMTI